MFSTNHQETIIQKKNDISQKLRIQCLLFTITVLFMMLCTGTVCATTSSWQEYALQMHIKENELGRYEEWPLVEKITLLSDLITMGYIEPSETSHQVLNGLLPEDESHALVDQLMVECIAHTIAVTDTPSAWWVDWSSLTIAFMGDDFPKTPAQKAWYQEVTNLFRSNKEPDVYVTPNENDFPEEQAVAIATQALMNAFDPICINIEPSHISTTLYVTDHYEPSSPDYRRWRIEFSSPDFYAMVIVDSTGLVIHDFELGVFPSIADFAVKRKTTPDENTPFLIETYVEYARNELTFDAWKWSVESKADYSKQVYQITQDALAEDDFSLFINPSQSDQPIPEVLHSVAFVYGLPSDTHLQEKSALALAKGYVADAFHIAYEQIDDFFVFPSFDITDPQNPLWKFVFCPFPFAQTGNALLYKIELSAETGMLIPSYKIDWDLLFQNTQYDLFLY